MEWGWLTNWCAISTDLDGTPWKASLGFLNLGEKDGAS